MTPEVTVTIPAYNAAAFLDETIGSVLSQTFQDWELVIADDCSTDDTRLIAERYAAADPRIRVVATPRGSGRCLEPRLLAAAEGRAPLVCPIDADDKIDPDLLEKLMARRRETGADIVLPVMWRWDGGKGMKRALPEEDFDLTAVYPGSEAALMTIGKWKIAFIASLMDRRKYLEAAADLPSLPGCIYMVEYLTRVLLDNADKVAFADTRYLYRINTESVTHRRRAAQYGYLLIDNLLRDYYDSHYGPQSEGAVMARVTEFHNLIDVIRCHRETPETDAAEHRKVEKMIADTYSRIDFDAIRPHVSRKYFMAMRSGLPLARLLISIHDRLKAR